MHSHNRLLHDEPNDGDNEEWVATVGHGLIVPAPLPTPENRIVLWVEKNEFNNHDDVSRTIGSNLKAMWLGPWQGWKDVSFHHHERLFERFQVYTYDTFLYDNAYSLIENIHVINKCSYVAILSMEIRVEIPNSLLLGKVHQRKVS
ncbi:hypothetical protein Hanom_Chr05g00422181 [Helianthus anomalus]